MDSFEFNKITASILLALLVAMMGSLVSEYLVHPKKLDKPVLVVEGDEAPQIGGKPTEEGLKPIAPLLGSASVERGQAIAKKCTQCHTFEKGGPNRTGPNLWGIMAAKIAHLADFAYSSGFKNKGGKWDCEQLNVFLHKPRSFVPATKMSFVGLQDAQERADVIAYLYTLNDTPIPLPSSSSPPEKSPPPAK